MVREGTLEIYLWGTKKEIEDITSKVSDPGGYREEWLGEYYFGQLFTAIALIPTGPAAPFITVADGLSRCLRGVGTRSGLGPGLVGTTREIYQRLLKH